MTQVEKGRNSKRPMGSGLGAVRPYAMNLGPVHHETPTATTEVTVNPVAVEPKRFTVLDQLLTQNRLALTEGTPVPVGRTKNNWTGR